MKHSKVFDKTIDAWLESTRYVSSCGGTRSGKTFTNLQLLDTIARKHPNILISVVSETFPHLKRGAIRDFQNILGEHFNEEQWSKSDSIYTYQNGAVIEFFSADSPAKVHGPARDILFLNEAQNINYDVARQLFVRTKGKVLIDYNPTHSFWVNEKIEPDERCKCVHSTYLDNVDVCTGESFLSAEQIAEIEANKTDANWWRVYGLGQVGVLEGLIYDFEQIDRMPDSAGMVEVFGMDFGFTHDPTALCRLLIDTGRKTIYIDELIHQKGLLNDQLAELMKQNGVPVRGAAVFADCAEPKTIADLSRYGFNIKPCYKSGRKAEQIQALLGFKLKVTKRSLHWIAEAREYTWAKDKEGKMLNEPIAINDHQMDAFRYGCFTWLAENRNKGQYNLIFKR